jgi:ribonuclease HI
MGRNYWHSYADCFRKSSDDDRIFEPGSFYDSDDDDDDDDEDSRYAVEVADDGWNHARCSHRSAHSDGIVIAADGACRHNGTTSATAAIGVYVAANSPYNRSRVLSPLHATSQKAELKGGIAALETALDIARHRYFATWPMRQLVVKADSAYLVSAMTDWICKWRRNGFRNAMGGAVTNASYFRELDALVLLLERRGVDVLFWHVGRSKNEKADGLANAALDAQ